MITSIYIENERLELFEDEKISVTSSVLDIQDISKNTTDYSNAFTVPASEINNKIFKHYYNANIDNTFDARVSVDGRIEIGGILFRNGKILLQKVNVKSGVASNYTINFWGNLVSLKDVLGEDKLSDLDLTAYDHPYDALSVWDGLTTPYAYASIIYTLLSKKGYYYNSDAGDVTMTDTLANIHYQSGTPNGVKFDDLRPSLRLIKIIEAIETKYPDITFSRDYFARPEFFNLFMWLNNSENGKAGGNTAIVNFTGGDTDFVDIGTNIGTFPTSGFSDVSGSEWFALLTRISPDAGFENVKYTLNAYSSHDAINYELIGSVTGTGFQTVRSELNSNRVQGGALTHYIYYEIVTTEAFEYDVIWRQFQNFEILGITTDGLDVVDSIFTVSKQIPDIKIIDFLKGLFNASKLVVIPENDGTIYVNTVNSFYAQGDLIDVTDYVDVESVDVSRGKILNDISYKFQDPTTILNKQFKADNPLPYGDEDAQLKDESGNLLDGEALEIEVPFEQIVYERIYDDNGVDEIELMYGAIIDENLNPVNPKASPGR